MMRTMLPTMTVLALLAGISGCFYPYRDWRGNGHGYESHSSRYEDAHVDRGGDRGDHTTCYRHGNDTVCRRD